MRVKPSNASIDPDRWATILPLAFLWPASGLLLGRFRNRAVRHVGAHLRQIAHVRPMTWHTAGVTRPLGRCDLEVSPVVLGTMASGRSGDEAARIRVIHTAIDAGITSLDTAPLYEFGRCEELVGRAIRDRRLRVQVLTKVGLRWDSDHGDVLFRIPRKGTQPFEVRKDCRPASVRRDVEDSLRRLGIDTIDLCQIHHPDVHTPIEDTMGALLDLRRAGKIAHIGVSNFDAGQVDAAQRALGDVPLASHQLAFSWLAREGAAATEHARSRGIGVLVYSPLASGALIGRPPRRGRLQVGDLRRLDPRFAYANARRIDRVLESAVFPVANRLLVDVPEVALAWLLAQPGVTSVIAGASTPAQVLANASAANLRLLPEEIADIAEQFEALVLDPDAKPPLAERMEFRTAELFSKLLRRIRRRLPEQLANTLARVDPFEEH